MQIHYHLNIRIYPDLFLIRKQKEHPAGQQTDLKDREGGRQYFCSDPEHDDDGSGSICPSLFLLYHDGKLFYEEPCGTDRADGGKSFGAGDTGGLQGAGTVYE